MKTDLQRAIDILANAAAQGDHEAAAELLKIAIQAAEHLRVLASDPIDTPGRQAIDGVATNAGCWPIICPAIEDVRVGCLKNVPTSLGAAAPIRIKKGKTKPREFSYNETSGFALDVFTKLDAERRSASDSYRKSLIENWKFFTEEQQTDWTKLAAILPPLDTSAKTIELWQIAGVAWAENICQGQWKRFPWPRCVKVRAEQETNSRKRGIEIVIREFLGKGLKSIAKPPTTY